MRTTPARPDDEDDDRRYGLIRRNENPEIILNQIDRLLEEFGLEIVQVDTGADYYLFRVDKRAD